MENRTSTPIQLHPTRCYKLADPKRGRGQTCAVATLACTNIEVCECPSGQHARGFQMGFEPQLAGRLVYNVMQVGDSAAYLKF